MRFHIIIIIVFIIVVKIAEAILSKIVESKINKVMDLVKNVGEIAGNVASAIPIFPFDLNVENVGGLFTNLTLLNMMITSLTNGRLPLTLIDECEKEYDYIIIGGGTAGSVMASRLSEKPCVSVLLLEAGGVAPILTEVPSFARFFMGSPIDWHYKTVPQKNCAFGQKDNRVIWNNGKVLGGSSRINAMFYVRGNMQNYDDWEAQGATGWSYKDVFPYFLKLENNEDINELDPGYHQKGGPVTMEKVTYKPEIKDPLLRATADMGYELRDINGQRQIGMYDLQMCAKNQQRDSADKAYLERTRASSRPNLRILTHAFARKILFSEEKIDGQRKAVAVQFDHGGVTRTVRARREVLVCNGALRTPQILMLSGIGPAEQLAKLNIDLIADLPVGKNLQDHYCTLLVYKVKNTISPVILKNINPVNLLNYITFRRGPLTSPTQTTLIAFLDGLNTSVNTPDFARQQLYFSEYATIDAKLSMNMKDELYDKIFKPYELKPLMSCFSCLLQPYSRGEITLDSTNPYDHPIFDPRYYEDERDLQDVVEGMKACNQIAKHPEMKEVKAELLETFQKGYPGCEEFEGDEDKHLACIARTFVNTFWHYSGTARMGRRDDPNSVVDPELRVIGVSGLRVINAAIMPILPSSNPNVPTMMIAEKAYDMMKRNIRC